MNLRAIALILGALCASLARAQPPADWGFKDWDAAVVEAHNQNKSLFILFGYEDCQWCTYLYHRGMNDAEVRAKYQQNFVVTYIDIKSHRPGEVFNLPGGVTITHGELINRFHAYPTPSWVFMSPSGVVLHTGRNGKTTAREMLRDVDVALAKSKNA